MCEAILALSGTTNGRLAVESFRALERQTGRELAQVPDERADERLTFGEIAIQPRKVIASAEWSGLESRERRYSPFTANVELLIPWRTLTGRQQLFVDHEWMLDLGEGLPAYRPPVDAGQLIGLAGEPDAGDGLEVTVRYLTPHSKWSIHSEFQDNLHDADPVPRRPGDVALATRTPSGSGSPTTTGSRSTTATATSPAAPPSRTACPPGVALFYHSQDRHVNVPDLRDLGRARRHRQLADADHDEADAT